MRREGAICNHLNAPAAGNFSMFLYPARGWARCCAGAMYPMQQSLIRDCVDVNLTFLHAIVWFGGTRKHVGSVGVAITLGLGWDVLIR